MRASWRNVKDPKAESGRKIKKKTFQKWRDKIKVKREYSDEEFFALLASVISF